VTTAEGRRFIETSLDDLSAPDSAIQQPSIEHVLRAGLRGEVTVMVVAEALFSVIREACIKRIGLGLEDDTGAETTPLESVTDRPLRDMASLPGLLEEFLREHPHGDWSVTEVVTRRDPMLPSGLTTFDGKARTGSILNLLGIDHLYGNRELFEWMHMRGSKVVRVPPLQCLLWDEARRAGDGGVAIRLTARPSSLESVRGLLSKRARPVMLRIPKRRSDRRYGSMLLHEGAYDELKALHHDVYHVSRWNRVPAETRWALQERVAALYDGFVASLPMELREDPLVVGACDELLSGPQALCAGDDPIDRIAGAMVVYLSAKGLDLERRAFVAIKAEREAKPGTG